MKNSKRSQGREGSRDLEGTLKGLKREGQEDCSEFCCVVMVSPGKAGGISGRRWGPDRHRGRVEA